VSHRAWLALHYFWEDRRAECATNKKRHQANSKTENWWQILTTKLKC
jgi:hypothetical protein